MGGERDLFRGITRYVTGPPPEAFQFDATATAGPVHVIVRRGDRMKAWIIERWDWMIYRFAHKSLERMCHRNAGFAYLFELWLREWRSRHPISPELERATEAFFNSLRDGSHARLMAEIKDRLDNDDIVD